MDIGGVRIPIIGSRSVVFNIKYLVNDSNERIFNITNLTKYLVKRVNLKEKSSISLSGEPLNDAIKWIISYLIGQEHSIITYLDGFSDGGIYDCIDIMKSSYVSFEGFCEAIQIFSTVHPQESCFFQLLLEFIYQSEYIEYELNK